MNNKVNEIKARKVILKCHLCKEFYKEILTKKEHRRGFPQMKVELCELFEYKLLLLFLKKFFSFLKFEMFTQNLFKKIVNNWVNLGKICQKMWPVQ